MATERRLKSLIGEEVRLEPFPDVALRAMEEAADEHVDNTTLASTIRLDPALTATVLRRANQIDYVPKQGVGQIREILELEVALSRIPRKKLIDLLVSSGLADFMSRLGRLPAKSLEFLWRRSVMCGILASMLSTDRAAYTAGLLQNVGQLVLASYQPEKCREIAGRIALGDSVQSAERAVVGHDHAFVGFVILREEWGLPIELVKPILRHHRPPGSGSLAASLNRADILTSNLLLDEATDPLTAWTVALPDRHRYAPERLVAVGASVEAKLADALSSIL